jgi:hypothetical protein
MARGRECGCHVHPQLVPQEVHHIWPSGYHGPDIPSNKVKICANAHSDIHYLMEAMLRGKPYDLREYGPKVRHYAIRGYNEVMAYAASLPLQTSP